MLRAAILAGLLLVLPATAEAAERVTVQAPTGGLRATLHLQDGVPRLAIGRGDRVLLAPAPLGLRTAAGDLTRGLRLAGRSPARRLRQRYRTVIGKRRAHRDVATRRVLRLAGARGVGASASGCGARTRTCGPRPSAPRAWGAGTAGASPARRSISPCVTARPASAGLRP